MFLLLELEVSCTDLKINFIEEKKPKKQLKKSTLSRHNLHTLKYIHFKCLMSFDKRINNLIWGEGH